MRPDLESAHHFTCYMWKYEGKCQGSWYVPGIIGTNNQNVKIITNKGPSDANIDHLMRGFQIWCQNWNRKTFDPLFDQKTRKWQNTQYGKFLTVFFGSKGCQMLFDVNFEDKFGILIILHPLHLHLQWFSSFYFFDLPCIIWLHN